MAVKKSVLITGCSDGGLGSALALAFHKKGYRVLATGRNVAKLGEMKKNNIETLTLDVLSAESIQACVKEVSKLGDGKLDMLINNAGAGYSMPLLDVDLEEMKNLFDLNVFSVLAVTQAFFPLIRRAQGTIVNNTSVAGTPVGSAPIQSVYNQTKAAAGIMTNNLRQEVKAFGVKVVDLKTGAVKTNFFANVGAAELPAGSLYRIAKEAIEKFMVGGELMTNAMTAEAWAARVVSDLSRTNPPPEVWRGTQATLLRYLLFFPSYWFDGILKKMVGLNLVEQRVKTDSVSAKEI